MCISDLKDKNSTQTPAALSQKLLLSGLHICKEIQPVHLKGNQSWVFTGRWIHCDIREVTKSDTTELNLTEVFWEALFN